MKERFFRNRTAVFTVVFVLLVGLVGVLALSLIHISEPTRRTPISYAVFCLKKKKTDFCFKKKKKKEKKRKKKKKNTK